MFEQSLYNQEPVATPLQEGDLFHNYEITNWELSPRIYKILGIAALANVFALFVFAQTSLLTMKGCDSPLVGRVCQVLDTVYVGSMLWGTDREYVDAVYDKTELGDADITFIDVSGVTPPLSYPEGYFQLANPIEYQAMLDAANNPLAVTDFAGIPAGIPITTPSTGGSLIDTAPNPPKANPNVVVGQLPPAFDSPGVAANPNPRKDRRGGREKPSLPDVDDVAGSESQPKGTSTSSSKATPTPSPSPDAQATEEAKEDKFGIFINKRPLTVQAAETLAKVDRKEVKLDMPFKVSIAGLLGLAKDGKTIVLKNPKPLPVEKGFRNDPKMEKLVQDWILAVGDAGWLGYLDKVVGSQKLKPKKVIVTVEQNDTVLLAKITAEQPTENEARTIASGLGVLLAGAVGQVDGDEQVFLKSASTTSEGNLLILNVNLPKPVVQEMIQRKLSATKTEPAPGPGSFTGILPPGNTAK